MVFVVLFLSLLAADTPTVRREAIEWTDVWFPHSNDRDLPRVLLIGDSITRAYYPAVEELLKDKAYVARIATSKAIGDPALLSELAVFLGQAKFDVVHFNIGMHGWTYSEDEYKKNFPLLVETIRKGAPGSRLIWAQTTPVRKDRENGPTNGRIVARNNIAKEIAVAEQISIDDLYSLMLPLSDLYSDDVHFNKGGSAKMAEQVAAAINKALSSK